MGVMIARDDMGIELSCERMFITQKMMIAKCNLVGKPVVCETQMLESMTYDVANALLDGVDLVMLSGEMEKGTYPIEAVQIMITTCELAESVLCYPPLFNELRPLTPWPKETTETVACDTVSTATEQNTGAIIVLSNSGHTARLVSKYRPSQPIVVVTRDEQTNLLLSSVFPFVYNVESSQNWDTDVEIGLDRLLLKKKKFGLLKSNDSAGGGARLERWS